MHVSPSMNRRTHASLDHHDPKRLLIAADAFGR
jgi:hypothetical protein